MGGSVGWLDAIEAVERGIKAHANGDGFRGGWREGHKAYGWGIACAYKNTGLGGGAPDKSTAEVEVFPDGTAEIRTSSAEMGQNLVGVLAACTAEELGLPSDAVRVLVMDTDRTPDGGPTTASRQTYVSGKAAELAGRALRAVILRRANMGDGARIALEGDVLAITDESGNYTFENVSSGSYTVTPGDTGNGPQNIIVSGGNVEIGTNSDGHGASIDGDFSCSGCHKH